MSEATTATPDESNATVALVAYISAAVGLIIILGITFFVLRRIRMRKSRKYIKQQANRSIAMGPVLTSQPPKSPWKWKEVKANIKARHKGEERPYSASKPSIAVISDGSRAASSNGVNIPQSAMRNGASSLGPAQRKMYGEEKPQVAHHIKHERLRKRIKIKQERRQMKERQKEIKRDLTLLLEGQRLPGDEFPEDTRSTSTHVGPLRRESLLEIPNLTYLIEQSPRDKTVHRSTGQKQLDIPQNLCTWEEERESRGSSSNLSVGRISRAGNSPRHTPRVLGEVTVHHVIDTGHDSDLECLESADHTTEL